MRQGPCSPWINGPVLRDLPAIQKAIESPKIATPSPDDIDALCAEAAVAASEVLYELSGRVFTGSCGPVTVRPVWRPTSGGRPFSGGLTPSSLSGSWFGTLAVPAVLSYYGLADPPELDLGVYPVREIVKVLIDGAVIPPVEYELRNARTLVRLRPTAGAQPTERWGWPSSQIMDLPDSEPGTFSVTFTFGQAPSQMGLMAVRQLGEVLVRSQLGDKTALPTRVQSMSRQGITAQAASVADLLKNGQTGLYHVDLFLMAVNPGRNRRQAAVWSPDVGRPRRTRWPTR